MIQNYINWEKKQIDWWKEKLGIIYICSIQILVAF